MTAVLRFVDFSCQEQRCLRGCSEGSRYRLQACLLGIALASPPTRLCFSSKELIVVAHIGELIMVLDTIPAKGLKVLFPESELCIVYLWTTQKHNDR